MVLLIFWVKNIDFWFKLKPFKNFKNFIRIDFPVWEILDDIFINFEKLNDFLLSGFISFLQFFQYSFLFFRYLLPKFPKLLSHLFFNKISFFVKNLNKAWLSLLVSHSLLSLFFLFENLKNFNVILIPLFFYFFDSFKTMSLMLSKDRAFWTNLFLVNNTNNF